MLFVSLADPRQPYTLNNNQIAIELRLDLCPGIDLEYVQNFLHTTNRPVMLTLRKTSHGGKYSGSEAERKILIEKLLGLEPSFFDLEYDTDSRFLQQMIGKYQKTKFVLSYHNFQGTPTDLDEIYGAMSKYPAFSYKLAAMAHSTNDALKLLLFAKHHPKLSAICMGEKGKFARVLGPVVGNLVDYGSVKAEEETGPGQLTIREWVDIYRYDSLNKETHIYGLIGDPVGRSIGHLYHNEVFQKKGLNAVYVKMELRPNDLVEFIPLAKAIGIRGLSVTMPLKERVLAYLDQIETSALQIGAINTLRFETGKIVGTNTDGVGALDAIERKLSVQGKKIVLLGAGGAARAIAFEAKKRGADLIILNRTVQRAKQLAFELNCIGGGLDEMPTEYDILVNCSPDPMPIESEKIKNGAFVMDVVCSLQKTPFLEQAVIKKCQIVCGEEMFFNQAAIQTVFWKKNYE